MAIKKHILFLISFWFITIPLNANSNYLNQTQTQNANNQFVLASKVQAKTLEIKTGVLKLISQKDLDYLQEISVFRPHVQK